MIYLNPWQPKQLSYQNAPNFFIKISVRVMIFFIDAPMLKVLKLYALKENFTQNPLSIVLDIRLPEVGIKPGFPVLNALPLIRGEAFLLE